MRALSLVWIFSLFALPQLGYGAVPCQIKILSVLEAVIYRGPPRLTQMLQNDPEHAEQILAESHGDHHLACTYQVQVNRQSFRYRYDFPDTLRQLSESYCESRSAKRQVRQSALAKTQGCTQAIVSPE